MKTIRTRMYPETIKTARHNINRKKKETEADYWQRLIKCVFIGE